MVESLIRFQHDRKKATKSNYRLKGGGFRPLVWKIKSVGLVIFGAFREIELFPLRLRHSAYKRFRETLMRERRHDTPKQALAYRA